MASRKIRTRIKENLSWAIHSDRVTAKANGTYRLERSFFYRHGGSSDKLAKRLMTAFGTAIEIVDRGEEWRSWPKLSYWWVEVRVTDEQAVLNRYAEGYSEVGLPPVEG